MSIQSLIAKFGSSVTFLKRTALPINTSTGRQQWVETPLATMLGWYQDWSSAVRSDFSAREIVTKRALFCDANPGVSENDIAVINGQRYKITRVVDQAGVHRLWEFGIEKIEP